MFNKNYVVPVYVNPQTGIVHARAQVVWLRGGNDGGDGYYSLCKSIAAYESEYKVLPFGTVTCKHCLSYLNKNKNIFDRIASPPQSGEGVSMLVTDIVNNALIEATGGCAHNWVGTDGDTTWHRCTKCGNEEHFYDCVGPPPRLRLDFSTWEGFGKLLEWAKKQTWWYDFIGISSDGLAHGDWETLAIELVNPSAFAIAIYEELTK